MKLAAGVNVIGRLQSGKELFPLLCQHQMGKISARAEIVQERVAVNDDQTSLSSIIHNLDKVVRREETITFRVSGKEDFKVQRHFLKFFDKFFYSHGHSPTRSEVGRKSGDPFLESHILPLIGGKGTGRATPLESQSAYTPIGPVPNPDFY